MPNSVTINLSRPIASATVIDAQDSTLGTRKLKPNTPDSSPRELQGTSGELPEVLTQTCQALRSAAAKLNEFYDGLFVNHGDQIAKLSVEIARKILLQKTENGDYEIESIIKEALTNAPSHHDVVVHLNPEDHMQFRKTLSNEPSSESLAENELDDAFAGVKFVPDPTIGRAECLLETPKGIVKSLIEENLERVSQALQRSH